jgi:hypothetical protein
MNGGPKDNANPIILDIEKKKKSRTNIGNITYNNDDEQQQPMYYNELIQSFRISNNNQSSGGLTSSTSSMITMDDYASIMSLKQTAIDSNNECISLFKKLDVWNHVDDDDHDNNNNNEGIILPHRQPNIFDHVMLFQEQKQQHDAAYRKKQEKKRKNDETTMESTSSTIDSSDSCYDSSKKFYDTITADEVFEVIRTIQDPEHPLTLEQLGVASCQQIIIHDADQSNHVQQQSTCTIYTNNTTLFNGNIIGLCIRVKLLRSLPIQFKTIVMIEPGTHSTEHAINKQLADKERVCAALENQPLLGVVNKCIKASDVNQ